MKRENNAWWLLSKSSEHCVGFLMCITLHVQTGIVIVQIYTLLSFWKKQRNTDMGLPVNNLLPDGRKMGFNLRAKNDLIYVMNTIFCLNKNHHLFYGYRTVNNINTPTI